MYLWICLLPWKYSSPSNTSLSMVAMTISSRTPPFVPLDTMCFMMSNSEPLGRNGWLHVIIMWLFARDDVTWYLDLIYIHVHVHVCVCWVNCQVLKLIVQQNSALWVHMAKWRRATWYSNTCYSTMHSTTQSQRSIVVYSQSMHILYEVGHMYNVHVTVWFCILKYWCTLCTFVYAHVGKAFNTNV